MTSLDINAGVSPEDNDAGRRLSNNGDDPEPTEESYYKYPSGPGHRSSRTGQGSLSSLLRQQTSQQSPCNEWHPSRQSLPVDALHDDIMPSHIHGDPQSQRTRFTSLPSWNTPDPASPVPSPSPCMPHRPTRPRFPHVDSEYIRRAVGNVRPSGGPMVYEDGHEHQNSENGYFGLERAVGQPVGMSSWAWPGSRETDAMSGSGAIAKGKKVTWTTDERVKAKAKARPSASQQHDFLPENEEARPDST